MAGKPVTCGFSPRPYLDPPPTRNRRYLQIQVDLPVLFPRIFSAGTCNWSDPLSSPVPSFRVSSNPTGKDAYKDTGHYDYILVMGSTGAGKTSLINAISNSALEVGHGLRSCTSEVGFSQPFEIEGIGIVMFDTPGFDDTKKTDIEIMVEIAAFLGQFHEQRKNLIGVIYLYEIHNARVGGTAVRNIKMFRMAVGEAAVKNVVVLTTKWDLINRATGEIRYREIANDEHFFKLIIDSGAAMQKYAQGDPPLDIVRTLVKKHNAIVLDIRRELVDEGKRLDETKAGAVLYRSIQETLREAEVKHNERMNELRMKINAQNGREISALIENLQRANDEKITELEGKMATMTMNLREVKRSSPGQRLMKLLLLAGAVVLSYSLVA